MKFRLTVAMIGFLWAGNLFAQATAEGIKMFRYERPASATSILQNVLKQNPQDITASYWLARVQLASDSSFSSSMEPVIPENLQEVPLAKITKGIIQLKKGDTIRAREWFNQALGTSKKKDPAMEIAIAEANIDAAHGSMVYALELLADAEKRDKKNPAIFMARGDAYRRMYNGSEAFRNYQQAIDLGQSDPVAFFKIGKIYQTQNNADIFTEYYDKALKADPSFGPVYYQLYYYYFSRDVNKAMDNLQKYIAYSDPGIKNSYMLTDQYFVSQKYTEAINEAKKIIAAESTKTKPRIYKLLAYSYDALNDSINATENLKTFFDRAEDTTYTADDFLLMAKLAETGTQDSLAGTWYEKALTLQTDSKKKAETVRKIIAFDKKKKDYAKQAYWFAQLRGLSADMSNVDIFNWGVANYNAQNYQAADSVFGIYAAKYPEQSFGYYWRARSNAAMDTAMETGIAVPFYEELIKVASKDTANANNRKWLIQAYSYVAAFKVNKEKMYTDALAYYDKILQLDPGNDDAEKYKGILEKMIESKSATDHSQNN
jgi:tetratricopeptide (TPR) repeat protein